MQAPEHLAFLTKFSNPAGHIKAVCNNYNQAFGDKAMAPRQRIALNDHLVRLFTEMEGGSVLVTFEKLNMGQSLSEANVTRERRCLRHSDKASFYDMKEYDLGPMCEAASWAKTNKKSMKAYKYTRIEQSKGTVPLLFCHNDKCKTTEFTATATTCEYNRKNAKKRSAFQIVSNKCPGCSTSLMSLRAKKRKIKYCK